MMCDGIEELNANFLQNVDVRFNSIVWISKCPLSLCYSWQQSSRGLQPVYHNLINYETFNAIGTTRGIGVYVGTSSNNNYPPKDHAWDGPHPKDR